MRSCTFLLIACACATAAPPSKPGAEAAAAAAREPAATRIVSVLELRNKQQLRDGPGIDAGYVADRLRAEVLGAGIDARVISRENMLGLRKRCPAPARHGARAGLGGAGRVHRAPGVASGRLH